MLPELLDHLPEAGDPGRNLRSIVASEAPGRVRGAITPARLESVSARGRLQSGVQASIPEAGGDAAEGEQFVPRLAEDGLGPYALHIGPAD